MDESIVQQFLLKRETCEPDNDYDGRMGVRISAVFVILASSAIGTFLPLLSSRYSFIRMPSWVFFIAKYFGSGVIVATAFIHLLEPASDSLGDECLGGTFAEYPWAFGIALMTLFALFFFEICAFQWVERKIETESGDAQGHSHSHFGNADLYTKKLEDEEEETDSNKEVKKENPYPKHFQHAHEHQDPELIGTPLEDQDKESYYGQLLSVFVLEFGVIFHSVFVGLSLSVSGDEFISLYIVLVFHQMFEGLGLGTRIALTNWSKSKRYTPWALALAYTFTTPIAIAIGLGVRTTYAPGSRRALITNGVFDSISAGILFYAGIVELMAHEFLYSGEFKGKDGFKKSLLAFFTLCWGAGLMALLGKWA
ncbi:Zinc/iron permease [Hyphopichia burtonii NRRL Y-1933]|uniref:Zinc/iron permease n=1 Tax=Hyphopichia burtonii NRRL Y-1933 TaxID=984485 RepID=A0A1E4RTE0_9ASCO|nr:Zinc/iron permease [Hyphopichia burtonii NRRL Y-1933]ODV70543.1 Zinc/iron permease [Hyphopichia burtonii NRRL Y-1933]